jgi:hypothetical protein
VAVGSTVARRGEEGEVRATLSVGPTANPESFLRKAILQEETEWKPFYIFVERLLFVGLLKYR